MARSPHPPPPEGATPQRRWDHPGGAAAIGCPPHRAAPPGQDASVRAVEVADLPVPDGWFAVATSGELAPGSLLPATLGGDDIVVARTGGGDLIALDAWCPHLGAHLGGGSVEGSTIRCPFHGFRFDASGSCTATGYGTPPPRRATSRSWPVIERNGAVLVHRGPEPGWAPPALDAEGWTPWRFRTVAFPGHPLDTNENSVDAGHILVLHGYGSIHQEGPVATDGPVLRVDYRLERPRRKGAVRLPQARATVRIELWGLGCSLVEATVENLGIVVRQQVLATPTERGELVVRIGNSVPVARELVAPWARRLPGPARRLLAASVQAMALRELHNDLLQDVPVWSTKRHVPNPVLAKGDGPIGRYRAWAAQFLARPAPAGDRSGAPVALPARAHR